MSQIRDTIKNKNKIEKARRARRKNEISTLRSKSIYKATLYDELKHVEIILQDPDINAVIIDIPDSSMSQFSNAIYSEDLVRKGLIYFYQEEFSSQLFYKHS